MIIRATYSLSTEIRVGEIVANADDDYWSRPFPLRGLFAPDDCCLRRVRTWLFLYARLTEACYLGCALDSAPAGGGSSGSITSMSSAELICIKADLDKAIESLPPRWQTVIYLRYREGLLQREIGGLLHCSQQRIAEVLRRAVVRMAAQLSANGSAGVEGA